MITVYTYYKNSNTGELRVRQKFTDIHIKFPINFYDVNNKFIGENIDLQGFVEISEKKWKREKRKMKKNQK